MLAIANKVIGQGSFAALHESAVGTGLPKQQHVRDQGESWRV